MQTHRNKMNVIQNSSHVCWVSVSPAALIHLPFVYNMQNVSLPELDHSQSRPAIQFLNAIILYTIYPYDEYPLFGHM